MADGDAIIIRELSGAFRSVVLDGPNLPEQLEVPVELRTVRTEYPGNSAASVQVMGTKEGDIVINGQFRDVWTGAEGDGRAKVNAVRAIMLAGRLCELSWGGTVVRRGLLKGFQPTFKRVGVITYRLTFEATEADEAAVVVPIPYPIAPEVDLAAVMRRIETRRVALALVVAAINLISGIR